MYKKILMAVNEFANSEVAARYALTLAKACRSRLFLVFAAEEVIGQNAFRNAEGALVRLFAAAEGMGIEVESSTVKGAPFKTISGVVREHGIDLVFTATRREDIQKRYFLRTHAREFMIKLPCSVAMVRVVEMGRTHPRNILVPLKGHLSQVEERAYFTAKLAQGFNARATILNLPGLITGVFQSWEQGRGPGRPEKDSTKGVEDFISHLERYKVQHERRTAQGSVARSITTEAAFRKNDLIIMGASERGLFKSLLSGNPVEDVLRETPCNLIVFRPGGKRL
jgi:nucleotide-binding universal stress UspA family protein